MVSKICVACNMKVAGSNKACARCGHVLTEKKTIGGRRYSEYRANLYLRLMNRKLRRHSSFLKENLHKSTVISGTVPTTETTSKVISRRVTPPTAQFSVPKPKPKPASLLRVIREEGNVPPSQESQGDTIQQSESKYFMRPKPVSIETRRKIAENRVRFTLALAEINRRILSQQLMWFNL